MTAVQELLGSIENTIPHITSHVPDGGRFRAARDGRATLTLAELDAILEVVGPPRYDNGNARVGPMPCAPGEQGLHRLPGGYDLRVDQHLVARARAEVRA